jgi:hypothetical protein
MIFKELPVVHNMHGHQIVEGQIWQQLEEKQSVRLFHRNPTIVIDKKLR